MTTTAAHPRAPGADTAARDDTEALLRDDTEAPLRDDTEAPLRDDTEPQVPSADGPPRSLETTPRLRRWLRGPRARWLAVALVVLALAGAWMWHYLAGHERTDDAYVEGPIISLASQVSGEVTQVTIVENQQVQAGDLLVQIDPREYQLAVRKAEADVAAAQARAAAAKAQLPIAETASTSGTSSAEATVARSQANEAAADQAVAAARARLEQAETGAQQADQDLERMRALVAKDEVPRASFDHAQAAATSAHAAVTEATQGVELALSRRAEAQAATRAAQAQLDEAASGPRHVEAARAQLAVATAQLAQAQAQLDLARKDLEDTSLRAPSGGYVGMKSVNEGETVRAGQPLLALVQLDQVWIVANFKETQIAKMRPGQRVKVRVDAYGRSFEARVESIGAATGAKFTLLPAQNATGNFVKVVQRVPVRIALEGGQDAEHPLRPGMSVVPTVILE